MVSAWRHQREILAGTRCEHLERMGRRKRRTRPCLWASVALVARLQRRHHRPDSIRARPAAHESELAQDDCVGVERGRGEQNGTATLPHNFPVLRGRRTPLATALPTLSRHVSRCAVQHRKLRPAAADDGSGDGLRGGRVHPHDGRHPPLSEPPRAGETATHARASTAAPNEAESRREIALRLQI